MITQLAHWRHCLRLERGATAVEYALMITFIAFVIITAVVVIGTRLSVVFADAGTKI